MRRLLARLRGDRRGVTVVEFGIIAPVMCLALLGLSDVMYQGYAQALLDGAIQKAGRDSAIQGGGDQATILDQRVRDAVRQIAPGATYTATRQTYSSFSAMTPERFTDANGNGRYDSTECFEDVNGNRRWDADPSRSGQGGASDATMYVVTVTYPRLFPVYGFMGGSSTQTLTARTLLKNQPYSRQASATSTTVCP